MSLVKERTRLIHHKPTKTKEVEGAKLEKEIVWIGVRDQSQLIIILD